MNGKEFTVSEVIDSFGINGHTWLSAPSRPNRTQPPWAQPP